MSYAEGWALYAESIGKELGVFTDPYQWYGRLSDEMLRAMRLVVDTGLHSKGWTREQAIQYMLDNSSLAESDVTAEVERYIVWPGQALGYKLGQLHISALRAKAQAAARRGVRRARVPQPGAARRRRADGRADREDRSLDRGEAAGMSGAVKVNVCRLPFPALLLSCSRSRASRSRRRRRPRSGCWRMSLLGPRL